MDREQLNKLTEKIIGADNSTDSAVAMEVNNEAYFSN